MIFLSVGVVNDFLNSVYNSFKPINKKYKFQGYFFFTENRNRLTNVYKSKYFNEFVRSEISNYITKRIICNGLTGSSWYFKRFERLNIIVVLVGLNLIKS